MILTILDYDQTYDEWFISIINVRGFKSSKGVLCVWAAYGHYFILSRWSDDMKDLKRFSL